MAPAGVAIPQEIVDAVAEAEAAATDAPPAEAAATDANAEGLAGEAPAEPVAEEPAAAAEEPEAQVSEEPEPPASEEPAADAEVSLEAILEDLKRREGRSE
jgi:ubiquinol-cytochrome c reductase cytochrome c1 subunit